MCGGGGGSSGTTQYNWNDTLAPIWQNVLGEAQGLNTTPYKPYQGQKTGDISRIANLTPDQLNAMQNIRLYTADPTYGVADPNQAQNAGITQELQTLSGSYLDADPYAGTTNPFMGDSPQFQSVLQSGLGDITNAYQQGTAADTTRMFNLAGAFGGSAHQQAMANNENALGKQLSQYTAGMQNDQYNRSAQLAESGLNRGSQAFQNERNRQISALSPTQSEQALALQRENALMGIGDINRSFNQDQINQNYQDYQNQQNQPFTMLDYLTGIMSRAQGGVSPNSSFTQSGYTASPYSQIIGAGLLGYGLTH